MHTMTNDTAKQERFSYFYVPRPLWRLLKKALPQEKRCQRGRPRKEARAVLNGIWYVLWTGCQWKAIHKDWFGVSSSVLHQRFQSWREQGVFEKMAKLMASYYHRRRGIAWRHQIMDSKRLAAPLGGTHTGRNPVNLGKQGSKIHLVVDERGAPLSLAVTGAHVHDKWGVPLLLVQFWVARPAETQVMCADKGYFYKDVQAWLIEANSWPHIELRAFSRSQKQRLDAVAPDAMQGYRWVVERTLSWLMKPRALRTRWCKKVENWIAFLHLASAHILFNLSF